jgi:hypothetical protein
MKILTEEQWWAKTRRHQAWFAARRAELASIDATLDTLNDIEALQRIIERAATIEKRAEQLERIVARHHLERAPPLQSDVYRTLQIDSTLQ